VPLAVLLLLRAALQPARPGGSVVLTLQPIARETKAGKPAACSALHEVLLLLLKRQPGMGSPRCSDVLVSLRVGLGQMHPMQPVGYGGVCGLQVEAEVVGWQRGHPGPHAA
jgi:hypothetical protein